MIDSFIFKDIRLDTFLNTWIRPWVTGVVVALVGAATGWPVYLCYVHKPALVKYSFRSCMNVCDLWLQTRIVVQEMGKIVDMINQIVHFLFSVIPLSVLCLGNGGIIANKLGALTFILISLSLLLTYLPYYMY